VKIRKTAPDVDDPFGLVYITRAQCPKCFSTDLQTYRSEKNGDGSTTRRTFCRSCHWIFRVVVELAFPNFGIMPRGEE
jgi:hypothetical protein